MVTRRLQQVLRVDDPWRHIGRFATVGTLGTLIDVSVFALLHTLLGVPALAANPVSFSLGITNNFIWHRRWTFAGRSDKAAQVQALPFLAGSLVGLVINTTLVLLFTAAFTAVLPLAPAYTGLLAKLCATAGSLTWSFIVNHFWTFQLARERRPA